MTQPIHPVYRNTVYDPDYIIPEWFAPYAPNCDEIKALIDQYEAGDIEAFRTLKTKYRDEVKSRLLRRGGLDSLAQNLIPDDPHERFALKFEVERLQTMLYQGGRCGALGYILVEQITLAYATVQGMEARYHQLEAEGASESLLNAFETRMDKAYKRFLQSLRTFYYLQKPQH